MSGPFLLPSDGVSVLYTESEIQTGQWVRKISAESWRGWKAFYHTGPWKRKRLEILRRDHYACQRCRMKGMYGRAVIVHHIQHLKDVPELALTDSNLISLCGQCHDEVHPEKHKRKSGFENVERW